MPSKLVHDGIALASFCPGEHVLSATDLPQAAQEADGLEAEIYYVNTAICVLLKWGMQIPYLEPGTTFREPDQVRSYGTIDIHIVDHGKFITFHVERPGELAGAQACDHKQVQGWIREAITQAMSLALRELTWPTGEHPARYQEVADRVQRGLDAPLAAMGAVCRSLTILGIERRSSIDPGHPMPGKGLLTFGGTQDPALLSGGFSLSPAVKAAMQAAVGQPAGQPDAPVTTADIMTLAEAAAYLQMPEVEALALIESGQIEARKIGAHYRIIRQKLDRWLAQRR
ncbi:MAG: SPFH domain-containing protein [Anaerolineae bacterium]|nr:SPFH domain-containing protein [Anaerolineae bacterium]